MLTWFRVRGSRIASVVFTALAVVGGSAVTPHQDDCHGTACEAIFVEHDASAHRFEAPSTESDVHGFHCLVCHWARSFRPRTEARVLSAPAVEAGISLPVERFTASAGAPAAQPPLRSPPASPVFA